MRRLAWCALALASGCGTKAAPAPAPSAHPTAVASHEKSKPASKPSAAPTVDEPVPSGSAAAGGGDLCGAGEGPFDLKRKGAPTLYARRGPGEADTVFVILNDGGRPDVRALRVQAGPEARKVEGKSEEKASSLPCAVASDHVFCADKEGGIHHAVIDAAGAVGPDEVVVRARAGGAIAAAPIGKGHTLLGYITDTNAVPGVVTEAFVSLDGKKPLRLSAEAAGGTFVALAARGEEVVAMYVSARAAITPVHARVVTLSGDELSLGPDAVVHLGGPFERYTTGAMGTSPKGPSFALVPMSEDDTHFALGAFRVDEQPKDDAPRTWTRYANGLDPAPVAATANNDAIVAVIGRPETADPKSPKVLELGKLGPAGIFLPGCIVDTAQQHTHVAIAPDRFGTLWIAWNGSKGAFVARRGLK